MIDQFWVDWFWLCGCIFLYIDHGPMGLPNRHFGWFKLWVALPRSWTVMGWLYSGKAHAISVSWSGRRQSSWCIHPPQNFAKLLARTASTTVGCSSRWFVDLMPLPNLLCLILSHCKGRFRLCFRSWGRSLGAIPFTKRQWNSRNC